MLHSKNLTQEGMELILRTLYKNGWRYIFRKGYSDDFYVSKERPGYSENDILILHPEHQARLSDASIALIADALKGRNYITITDHVDIIDWSTVEVDTPVKIFYDNGNLKCRRHFAYYRDGQVYVFPDGKTSWTAIEQPVPVKNVSLAGD